MEGLKEGIEAACVSWMCSKREEWYVWIGKLSLPEIETWETVAPRIVRVLYEDLAAPEHERWENQAHMMDCFKHQWGRHQWGRIVLLAAGKKRALDVIRRLHGKYEVVHWSESAYVLRWIYPEETWLAEVHEEASKGWNEYLRMRKLGKAL